MKKFLLFAGVAACAAMTLSSCNKDALSLDQYLPESDMVVTLLDANTNELITDVNVTLVGVETEARVAAAGTVTYKSLRAGEYSLLVEKEGYASMLAPAFIYMAADGDRPVAAHAMVSVPMFKLGSTYSGTASYTTTSANETATYAPLANAELRLNVAVPSNFDAEFVSPIYRTTTDASGNFSYTNLPEGAEADHSPIVYHDGNHYYSSYGTSLTLSLIGEKTLPDQLYYNPINENGPFDITAYQKRIKAGSNIVISFNYAVEVSALNLDDIHVLDNNHDYIAIHLTWSNDNKTLTIVPVKGTWDLGEVRVYISVRRVQSDQSINDNLTIDVIRDGALGAISNLAADVDEVTEFVTLTWNAAANATFYEIYCKRETDANFIYLKTVANDDTETEQTTINDPGFSDDNETVQYMVIAYNEAEHNAFNTALTVTAKRPAQPTR